MNTNFPFSLTQLIYFAECARTLSMTAASRELHVVQSAVSTAVIQLERSLGAKLFVRQRAKGLVLTAAGEQLLHDTRYLFDHLNSAVERVRDHQVTVQGTIRVAFFSTFSAFLLPWLIQRIQAQYPSLKIEFLEGNFEENLLALKNGSAELAVNYDLMTPPEISHEIVGKIRPYVLLHSKHEFASYRSSVKLQELIREDFILLDLPSSKEYFLSIFEMAGVSPKIKYRSSNFETVRSMVSAGLGYSLLNQRPKTVETYAGKGIKVLEIDDDVPELGIAIASLSNRPYSARAKAVIEELRKLLQDS